MPVVYRMNEERSLSLIIEYFNLGCTYKEIVLLLSSNHGITVSLRSLQRRIQKKS